MDLSLKILADNEALTLEEKTNVKTKAFSVHGSMKKYKPILIRCWTGT